MLKPLVLGIVAESLGWMAMWTSSSCSDGHRQKSGTNLFGSQSRKWEGKSDGVGPADLHMMSTYTHSHTQKY